MIRYQLFEKNSPWGVLKDGQGNQYYQHLVDFPDNDKNLKLQFLKDECGLNIDELKNSAPKWNGQMSANELVVKINKENYPELNLDDIYRKDFLIMYDDSDNSYKFWSIEISRDPEAIRSTSHFIVKGARDWFFELGPNNMFNNEQQAVIERGMIDNITEDGNWNISPESDNNYAEGFDEFADGSFKPIKEINFNKDYSSLIKTPNVPQWKIDDINEKLNLGFAIIKFQTNLIEKAWLPNIIDPHSGQQWGDKYATDSTEIEKNIRTRGDVLWSYTTYEGVDNEAHKNGFAFGDWDEEQKINNKYEFANLKIKTNYGSILENNIKIAILPHFDFKVLKDQKMNIATFENLYQYVNESEQVYQITELNFNPLEKLIKGIEVSGNNYEDLFLDMDYELGKNCFYGYRVVDNYTDPQNNKLTTRIMVGDNNGRWNDKNPQFLFLGLINPIEEYDYISEEININNSDYNKDYEQPFIINNIGKLYSSSFLKYTIKTSNKTSIQIIQDYLKDKFQIGFGYTYDIMTNHNYYNVIAKDTIYDSSFKYGLYIEEFNNYSYRLISTKINDLLLTNGQSLNQQAKWNQHQLEYSKKMSVFNTITDTLSGGFSAALSGIGSFMSGNMIGVGSAIGSGLQQSSFGLASQILQNRQTIDNNINNIKMFNAKLKDAQNSPNQLKGNGDDLMGVITRSDIKPAIFIEELQPNLKSMIAWHFQMFGVNLGSIPRNINDFLTSRYHFNYIQTGSLLENWNQNAPNSVRQVIDKSMMNGITFWHYRDKKTWRGIKNYNVNNVEMKYFVSNDDSILDGILDMEMA